MNEVSLSLGLPLLKLILAFRVQWSRDHGPERYPFLRRMGEPRYPQHQWNALRKLSSDLPLMRCSQSDVVSITRLPRL